mmetsp:Transcript_99215/g.289532  ORF Transcript_99215/g.289532 Transcript_99215/m.289532 type:complete len:284 (+) Transcript_99215:49-900(+)
MIHNAYSPRTLNGNWLEDRHQPGEALTATGQLHKKSPRAFETDLAFVCDRYDVLQRVSRMPHRVTYAMPDDGFNAKTRTSTVDYQDPKARPEFSKVRDVASCMINTANAPVCPPEQRPVPGPRSGFGAAVKRHAENHDVRLFNTAMGDFYGPPTHRHPPRPDPCDEPPAGINSQEEEQRVPGRRVGRLCAECLKESPDPAVDTRTQRSWLYHADPSLRHAEGGGARPPQAPADNPLSLPLGDGAMSKVRADFRDRQGRLYRTGTAITKGKSPRSGVKVFTDDE